MNTIAADILGTVHRLVHEFAMSFIPEELAPGHGVDPEAALTAFGFNRLESTVYCELLRQSPATGYRLGQRLGRAPSNIYQALKALMQKGAIVESGTADATSYVPVPPEQLFAGLRQSFTTQTDVALEALRHVHRPPTAEVLSQLRTAQQVIERARSMIDGARHTVIFDMVPDLLDLLAPEMNAARARGIEPVGIAYREADAGPTMPFKGEPAGSVRKRWPGLGIIVVTDATEQLVAQVSADMTQVLNAIYSDSAFLSCIMHGLLHSDVRLNALNSELPGRVPPSPLDAYTLKAARPPGLNAMLVE